MSDAMKSLVALSVMWLDYKKQIEEAEAHLKFLQGEAMFIDTELLPDIMRELEMQDFTLENGTKVKVTETLNCAITEANREKAHQWLRDNKFGGIIKTVIMQEYAAGEIDEARKNAEAIAEVTEREANIIETIHASTLKSFLKEQRKKGTKIPQVLFGLFPFSKAKVVPPKG